MKPEDTRRRFLRGAAALGTGFAAVTSGCLATLPPLGRRVRFGRVDTPEAGDPTYRSWIPVSSELPDGHGYGMMIYTTPKKVGEDTGASVQFPAARFPGNLIRARIDYFGVGYENYDAVLRFGSSTILLGDIDTDKVAGTLSETQYDSAGSYKGYKLFDRDDLPRTVAVDGSAVVFSKGEGDDESVRAIVDAHEGSVPRLHEEEAGFSLLTEKAGATPFIFFGMSGGLNPGEPSHEATSFEYDDSGVYLTRHLVYPEGELPSEVDIRDVAEEHSRALASESVDIEFDGRVVSVEMLRSRSEFLDTVRDAPRVPQVTWGVEHDTEAGEVILVHEGGDSIDAENLLVKYDQSLSVEGSRAPVEADSQFSDSYDEVMQGGELTVEVGNVQEDDTLILYHISGDSTHAMVMYELGTQSGG